MDTGRILTPEQQKRFHSLLRRGFNKRGSRPETPPEQPK
jgi:Spy/CpxP family protein refolding chaperone